ncbi:PhnD/SsuA/transferrin family substrate-binding protein [Mycobacterium sp. KBS0706]|uniref:phosphate/phosphite/phosphonate ABC transporter substrate-binding protein n=1 Tax=Mycobacterium sp. KBS0706 TaxID=2578109 RepID=UPI00110F7F16|nr:PhnD/SsuA/transferrin family substrate-binding protein [Mycobacterium sp. KBS0706]TSD88048.1 PhnD/SsuA/transferrin family substrate-binding protein [Mycobacterium sp. KBS0706]
MAVPGTVSLPMYDLPEIRWATDALWSAVAARLSVAGVAAPPALSRGPTTHDLWADPALLLSQTCGNPYVRTYRDRLRLVATPRYAAPGCDGPRYCSQLVVRAAAPGGGLADFRGAVCAVNGWDSLSGWVAFAAVLPEPQFFRAALVTGAHADSVAAVAVGEADIAAIDCVTYALLQRHRPASTAGLRVIGRTALAPSLPLVTRRDVDDATVAALQSALRGALADPALAEVRAALLIDGIEILGEADYDAIPPQPVSIPPVSAPSRRCATAPAP